jgi:drug/metabolite transporter (DMT)-like permease
MKCDIANERSIATGGPTRIGPCATALPNPPPGAAYYQSSPLDEKWPGIPARLTHPDDVRSIRFQMDSVTSEPGETSGALVLQQNIFLRKPVLAFAVLIAVNAMWAFQFSGARIATRELGPVLVTFVPLALATLLVMPFTRLNGGLFKVEHRRILVDIILLGSLGIVPAQLCLVYGVERTLASNASVLALTVPILTALSASVFLGERLTRLRILSFAVAILGVCIVSARDIHDARLFRLAYVSGNLFVLASCAGSAFYNSYSRRALSQFSPAQVLVWSFIVADLELLVFAAFKEPAGWVRLTHLEPMVWWTLILLAIFSLGLSMLLYFSVIQGVEVMRAALSIYLLPVFGLLFAVILLGEKFTTSLLVGGAMIFASCFLVTVYEEHQRMRKVQL